MFAGICITVTCYNRSCISHYVVRVFLLSSILSFFTYLLTSFTAALSIPHAQNLFLRKGNWDKKEQIKGIYCPPELYFLQLFPSLTPNGHWDFCCHEQTKFNCRTMRAGWAWPKAWSNSCSFLCVSGDSCHIMGCLLLAHLLRAGRHLKLSVEEFISSSIQLVQLSLAALSYSTFILWTSYCLHPFS